MDFAEAEWDNIHHLDYVWRQVREYEAQRILWVEVKPDGSVEVFAGVSKDVIRSVGHAIDLRKTTRLADYRLRILGLFPMPRHMIFIFHHRHESAA